MKRITLLLLPALLASCTVGDVTDRPDRFAAAQVVAAAQCAQLAECVTQKDFEGCYLTTLDDICQQVDCTGTLTPLEDSRLYDCIDDYLVAECRIFLPASCMGALGL
jgi:hypothetical protein